MQCFFFNFFFLFFFLLNKTATDHNQVESYYHSFLLDIVLISYIYNIAILYKTYLNDDGRLRSGHHVNDVAKHMPKLYFCIVYNYNPFCYNI